MPLGRWGVIDYLFICLLFFSALHTRFMVRIVWVQIHCWTWLFLDVRVLLGGDLFNFVNI